LIAARLPADPITGDAAQRAARQELREGAYHRDDPGPFTRLLHWFGRRIEWLLSGSPAGSATLVLLVLLVAVVIFAVVRAGTPRRTPAYVEAGALDRPQPLTAGEHRDRAEQLTASGRWADALREWLRTCVATLEERGLLDPRPGRTAADIARAGGAAIPSAAPALREAAAAFDEVWFGGRPATPADVVLARDAAERVRTTRTAPPRPVPVAGYAVPR
jgi:hypothetical protein